MDYKVLYEGLETEMKKKLANETNQQKRKMIQKRYNKAMNRVKTKLEVIERKRP